MRRTFQQYIPLYARHAGIAFGCLTLIVSALGVQGIAAPQTQAQEVSAEQIQLLQTQISTRNVEIRKLEAEIAEYQTQIKSTQGQSQTLQKRISEIDLTIKKLQSESKLAQLAIQKSQGRIATYVNQIDEVSDKVTAHTRALTNLIVALSRNNEAGSLEMMLSEQSLASAWDSKYNNIRLQNSIEGTISELRQDREQLASLKGAEEKEKQTLEGKRLDLLEKQDLNSDQKAERQKILTQTKNQEREYQKILADKVALRDAFEREMRAYETQLKIAIDPSSVPQSGSQVLSYPLANPIITQQFGDTEFSRQNALVYSGKGHNGIDFGTPVGTAILSAAEGTVIATGNTDTVCPGASYGKWVMIEHPMGLSTLYAHLSIIRVSAGQTVARGETIAQSGNTGYSTGPHLHFTVYASQGVQVLSRKSQACGGTYTMPIADLKAYLNPLLYIK